MIIPKEEVVSAQRQMFQCLMSFCALHCHVFSSARSAHLSPRAGVVQEGPWPGRQDAQAPDAIPPGLTVSPNLAGPWLLPKRPRGLQWRRRKRDATPTTLRVHAVLPPGCPTEHDQVQPPRSAAAVRLTVPELGQPVVPVQPGV